MMRYLARRSLFLVVYTAVLLATGISGGEHGSNETRVVRALFVGNSLTYANDMPAMIASLARSVGKTRFEYEMVALPNFSLEDHWNDGRALKAIRKGRWDMVIMQQGPSAGKEGRDVLLKYSRLFAEEIRKNRSVPAMYMVWPSMARIGDLDGVRQSYRMAADEIDGQFYPVGEAMRNTFGLQPPLPLFEEDRFHPNRAGSLLAALVMFEQMFDVPLETLLKPNVQLDHKLSRSTFELLVEAASKANAQHGRKTAGT